MDDLSRYATWLMPLLLAVLGWLATQLRETRWEGKLADRIGLSQREHEQDWEFKRRLGFFWFSMALILGAVTYLMGRHLLDGETDAPIWQTAVFLLSAILCIASISKSVAAFWVSRRHG